jgi:serine/threonine protein kinase
VHSLKILHRDIVSTHFGRVSFTNSEQKPENLLIDSQDNLKIADFGISMEYHGREGSVRQHAGTAAFMAPEMCSPDILEFPISGIDVWSAGITLWMFVFGSVPFIGSNVPETYEKILHSP